MRDIIGKCEKETTILAFYFLTSFSSAWWFWLGRVKREDRLHLILSLVLLTTAVHRVEKKEHQVITYKRL